MSNVKDRLKNQIYHQIKEIKNNYDSTQPWLTPHVGVARNTVASRQGRRADSTGLVRNLKMSDMGSVELCETSFATSYAGVAVHKPVTGSKFVVNSIFNGTLLHKQVEGLTIPQWVTPSKEQVSYYRRNTIALIPSIGEMTTAAYTGKKVDGIRGELDAWIPEFAAIVEYKSEWNKLPDTLPIRANIQGGMYTKGLLNRFGVTPAQWVVWIYLPSDLSTLIPEDVSTYRVFIHTAEEALTAAESSFQKAIEVAYFVDKFGWELPAHTVFQCSDTVCRICPYI